MLMHLRKKESDGRQNGSPSFTGLPTPSPSPQSAGTSYTSVSTVATSESAIALPTQISTSISSHVEGKPGKGEIEELQDMLKSGIEGLVQEKNRTLEARVTKLTQEKESLAKKNQELEEELGRLQSEHTVPKENLDTELQQVKAKLD
ncbi:hypothetical protein MPER_15248, partial [Moniliophthora perniciosa FA553]